MLGINWNPSKLDWWASLVGCEVGSFPSSYLDLSLGNDPESVVCLGPNDGEVIETFLLFEEIFLFYGGRFTLIGQNTNLLSLFVLINKI